jgi:DNA relaxase NicK
MFNSDENQQSYLPVYDTIPDDWEEGRQFLVENLKKISEAVNIREIGWVLQEQLLTGKNFQPTSNNSQEFRSIFRKLIPFSSLSSGVNTVAHGITFDSNFTLLQIYGGATNTSTFTAAPIPGGSMTVTMDATNVIVTSPSTFQRAWVIIEYILEV